ncbi:MAG: hypothetical protein ACFFD2_25440, partial [Promethearchaeota archaeon]
MLHETIAGFGRKRNNQELFVGKLANFKIKIYWIESLFIKNKVVLPVGFDVVLPGRLFHVLQGQ